MMRCNDLPLRQLLTADESSAEYRLVASHVEGCHRCQQRLLELSGDVDLHHEVRDTLRAVGETEPYRSTGSSSVVVSVDGNAGDEIGAECEPISLDFLSAPSHPEMLGRIGRYEVERMIGSGGMGIVLKGFDTELHRVVAIKVLKPHLAHIGAARHRFAREAQSAAAVVHEHVIPIHDVQSDGSMPFLVMQYVPGQSLQARVDERGPLDVKEVLRIARQAAAGLAAAHAQGLVHRDVKPANILMEESVERVLISDFGLARTVDDATLTRTGIVAGTPHYMSPEQASGNPVDHRSDLFSLGSVIYFMCTGRPPFRAEHALAILNRICHDTHRPVDEVNPDVPAELAELVDQLLSKSPADRFRDASDVEQQIGSILSRLQQGRRSTSLRWRRGWQRWRGTVTTAASRLISAAICVLAGIGIAWWMLNRSPTGLPQSGSPGEGVVSQRQDIERPSDDERSPAATELRPISQFEGESEDFVRGLSDVSAEVLELQEQWSRSATDISPLLRMDDDWQQQLEAARAAVQLMEQGPATPKNSFRPSTKPSEKRD